MFRNWRGINHMDLSAYLADLKKLKKNESVTKELNTKHKKYKGLNKWSLVPLGTTLILTTE